MSQEPQEGWSAVSGRFGDGLGGLKRARPLWEEGELAHYEGHRFRAGCVSRRGGMSSEEPSLDGFDFQSKLGSKFISRERIQEVMFAVCGKRRPELVTEEWGHD